MTFNVGTIKPKQICLLVFNRRHRPIDKTIADMRQDGRKEGSETGSCTFYVPPTNKQKGIRIKRNKTTHNLPVSVCEIRQSRAKHTMQNSVTQMKRGFCRGLDVS